MVEAGEGEDTAGGEEGEAGKAERNFIPQSKQNFSSPTLTLEQYGQVASAASFRVSSPESWAETGIDEESNCPSLE